MDQLDKIFSIVGQPTEATMPGCTKLPNYHTVPVGKYPQHSKLRQASGANFLWEWLPLACARALWLVAPICPGQG